MPTSIIESPRTRNMKVDARPGELFGQGEELFDVLLREDAGTAATSPTNGTKRVGAAAIATCDEGRSELDGAGLGGVALEVALTLEHGQMGVDGRRGVEADGLADLAHRGGIATLAQALGDEFENLAPLVLRTSAIVAPSAVGARATRNTVCTTA